jgi:RimJ/RimL family protein N-acetyltransferase
VVAPSERFDLDRLVLRRERLGDADLIAGTVQANLGHLRPWMPWAVAAAGTTSAQHDRLTKVEQWWVAGSDYTFLVLDPDEQTMLGNFGLHRRIGPNAIEMGYWLTRDPTGHGSLRHMP